MDDNADHDSKFPCSLTIRIPFPTARLASTAHKALSVDKELSPLVIRHFSLQSPSSADGETAVEDTILTVRYKATTNRMLRVAVNSFMDSLGLVIDVMEGLDRDVLG